MAMIAATAGGQEKCAKLPIGRRIAAGERLSEFFTIGHLAKRIYGPK